MRPLVTLEKLAKHVISANAENTPSLWIQQSRPTLYTQHKEHIFHRHTAGCSWEHQLLTARGKLRNHPDIPQEAEYRSPKMPLSSSLAPLCTTSLGTPQVQPGFSEGEVRLHILGSHPSIPTSKKAEPLGKINKSSWICQRSEVTGPTAAPKLERQVGGHGRITTYWSRNFQAETSTGDNTGVRGPEL